MRACAVDFDHSGDDRCRRPVPAQVTTEGGGSGATSLPKASKVAVETSTGSRNYRY